MCRIEELILDSLEQRKLADSLSSELSKKCDLDKTLKEVLLSCVDFCFNDFSINVKFASTVHQIVNKFYRIRKGSSEGAEYISWDDKCDCLMNDSAEMWSFSEDLNKSTSRYMVSCRFFLLSHFPDVK